MVPIDPNWAEHLFRLVTNPLIAPLLLSLGLLGLVFEIKHGAFGLGILLSLVSLGLFFGSTFFLGLAGWEVVLLLGLGLLALLVEVFILPGFGAAGILALVSFGAAIVLAMAGASPTTADVLQALARARRQSRHHRCGRICLAPALADEHTLRRALSPA